MTTALADRSCTACRGSVAPLKGEDLQRLARQLSEGWEAVDEHHLERVYRFEDFRGALTFTNALGEIAEQQGHHPEITLGWGKARVLIWTHKIDGLTESDFILAAKADRAFEEQTGTHP